MMSERTPVPDSADRPPRIGLLGGTFDPPHRGHIQLARAALEQLDLDTVIFVPAAQNPLKRYPDSSPEHRFEMVRLCLDEESDFQLSDIETNREPPSYTIETVEELQMVMPGHYWLILGTDVVKNIEQWKNWEKLIHLTRLAVAQRVDDRETLLRLPSEIQKVIDWIPLPPIPISSSKIREAYGKSEPINDIWLHPHVREYIEQNKLYRTDSTS